MGDLSAFPHSAYRHTPSFGESGNLIPFERFYSTKSYPEGELSAFPQSQLISAFINKTESLESYAFKAFAFEGKLFMTNYEIIGKYWSN